MFNSIVNVFCFFKAQLSCFQLYLKKKTVIQQFSNYELVNGERVEYIVLVPKFEGSWYQKSASVSLLKF